MPTNIGIVIWTIRAFGVAHINEREDDHHRELPGFRTDLVAAGGMNNRLFFQDIHLNRASNAGFVIVPPGEIQMILSEELCISGLPIRAVSTEFRQFIKSSGFMHFSELFEFAVPDVRDRGVPDITDLHSAVDVH